MAVVAISIPKAPVQDVLRVALRVTLIGLAIACLLPPHLAWRRMGWRSPWAALFLRVATLVLGMRVRPHGAALRRDVFFVANHVSWHDVLILGGLTGTAFVAQDGVRKWPVIGWLATFNGTTFISRTDKQSVASQVDALRGAIAGNDAVALFPEGTTSDGLGLLPFKPSLFAALAPPPKPMLIQPVLLDFGAVSREIAWLGQETGGESAWRALARKGSYRVDVHFLEPFDPRSHADRKAVCEQARSRIARALGGKIGA